MNIYCFQFQEKSEQMLRVADITIDADSDAEGMLCVPTCRRQGGGSDDDATTLVLWMNNHVRSRTRSGVWCPIRQGLYILHFVVVVVVSTDTHYLYLLSPSG